MSSLKLSQYVTNLEAPDKRMWFAADVHHLKFNEARNIYIAIDYALQYVKP